MVDLSGVTSVMTDAIPVVVTAGVASSFLPRKRRRAATVKTRNRKEKTSFSKAQAEAKRLRKEYPKLTVNVKEIPPGNFGVRFSPKGVKDKFDKEYPYGHVEEKNMYSLPPPKSMPKMKIPKPKLQKWGKMRRNKQGGYTRKRK